MKVSASLPPTMVSPRVDTLTATMSLPLVQLVKVQVPRLSEPPVAMLRASVLAAALPVIAVAILPAPNWALPNVAVEVPDVLAKATPSMLTKPFTPSDAAPLTSMLVPAPEVPICSVSVFAPPSNLSVAPTWAVAVTMIVSLPAPPRMVSVAVLAVMVSLPADPFTVSVSVPLVQLLKVQPDMSSVPPVVMLTTRAFVPALPVRVSAFEILPAPNWALLKVAVEVPDVLAKAMPSKLRKPLTPSAAAPLRSMVTPWPAGRIWIVWVPARASYVSVAVGAVGRVGHRSQHALVMGGRVVAGERQRLVGAVVARGDRSARGGRRQRLAVGRDAAGDRD